MQTELTEQTIFDMVKTALTFEELQTELGITVKCKFLALYQTYEIILKKRNNKWTVRFRVGDSNKRLSGFTTKKEAEKAYFAASA